MSTARSMAPSRPSIYTSSSTSSSDAIIVVDKVSGKRYQRGKFLGKGGFAKCYEMVDLATKKVLAGKIVAKDSLKKHSAKEKLSSEIKIHRSVTHKHIVQFHRFFEDRDNVYILLELCSNKSMMELHKRRRGLTEPEARFYLKQIVIATQYMHQRNIIHRDLKLGNLFLNDQMHIKVGDFGLATKVVHEGERKKTLCGTPNYIAPEILDGKHGHSFEVDVWSIGCILYTMLVGKPPFETKDIKETYRRIKTNEYRIPSNVSADAQSLIRAMLSKSPTDRPTLEQILDHPFLSKGFIPETLPSSSLRVPPVFSSTSSSGSSEKTQRSALRDMNNLQADSQKDVVRSKPVEPRQRLAPAPQPPRDPALLSSLSRVHKRLTTLVDAQKTVNPSPAPDTVSKEDLANVVTISKWVDYSNKYGLGYQLSTGEVGVLFNDSTKMILSRAGGQIEFVDRDSRGGSIIKMTMSEYPPFLEKKVTLLKYFQNYMQENLLDGAQSLAAGEAKLDKAVYVKKWLRTKHAIAFRLSNNVIQLNFFDHTKLIVNPYLDLVTFINSERVSSTYTLSDVANCNHQSIEVMVARLSYMADVVGHMVQSSSNSSRA